MKTSTLILFLSAAFLISAVTCDPCSASYDFADTSIINLKNNFLTNMYENMFEDFENIMKSAELIQDSCSSPVDFSIQANQLYTCSLAYSVLSELLGNYRFENEHQMASVLGQIVSLIPSIQEKSCIEEWEVTTMQNQQLDDDFWLDEDSSDDYDYDATDNGDYMVEDEEDEETGDEIRADSDDETMETENVPEAEEKIITIDWTVMQQNVDSDDDDEEEEEEVISHGDSEQTIEDDSIMVFVEIPKFVESDFDMSDADNSVEASDVFIVGEDPMVFGLDDILLSDDETELETNTEAGEDSLSRDLDMSGEVFLDDEAEDSLFVFVDVETANGIDQIVNSLFNDEEEESDMDVIIGELDLSQYYGNDEEEEESLGDY